MIHLIEIILYEYALCFIVFVSQFLDKALQIQDNEGTHYICKAAYDNTLAKYHPWLVKKGAHVAMYALPTKRDLFAKVSYFLCLQ